MKAMVLVGGSGTRLWPLSRGSSPKQFLELSSGGSFFAQTIQRLLAVFCPADIVIVTGEEYRWQVLSEIKNTGITNVVCEPCARNTAPAIALGVSYCHDVLGVDEKETVFVFPSDHLIKDTTGFISTVQLAGKAAQDDDVLIVFGIQPTSPETGYGYMETVMDNTGEVFRIKRFVEKPDADQARRYLKAGNFFWNSGMFAFTPRTFTAELAKHCPAIHALARGGYQHLLASFAILPKISFDYAVMEKTAKVLMLPLTIGWSDVGSWDSLYDEMEKDSDGNIIIGDVFACGVKNSLLIGSGRLVGAIGVEDIVLVGVSDATLAVARGKTQQVRDIVTSLAAAGRIEALEAPQALRPWGSYNILEENIGHKVKRLEVTPGAKISLQTHCMRSEHWVVVKGQAKIRIGKEEMIVRVGEAVHVPSGVLHRIENAEEEVLQIIEVQTGDYLGEDDIARFDDDYGRGC